jgi:hypothetical protein
MRDSNNYSRGTPNQPKIDNFSVYIYIHMCIYNYNIYLHIHTYIHIYIDTYIHTYIYTYSYIWLYRMLKAGRFLGAFFGCSSQKKLLPLRSAPRACSWVVLKATKKKRVNSPGPTGPTCGAHVSPRNSWWMDGDSPMVRICNHVGKTIINYPQNHHK